MQRGGAASTKSNIERTLNDLSSGKKSPWFGFVLLWLLYIAASIALNVVSRSPDVLVISGQPIPLRSLSGVFSSISNIFVILVVVLYQKIGFVTSLVVLLAQFPLLTFTVFAQQNFTSIPGFFMNLMTILAIIIIYAYFSSLQRYQMRLREQAVRDWTTGLPNRYACTELMDSLTKRKKSFGLALVGLNNFKNISSTMGQRTVDSLLAEIGSRFKAVADCGDEPNRYFITRFGEDEFALIVPGPLSSDEIMKAISRFEGALSEKFTIDDCDYYLTANVGFAEYPHDADNGDALLVCAHTALAETRRTNSSQTTCRFSQDLMNVNHFIEVEGKIRSALDDGRVYFQLQPQYDISHNLRGFEALARIKEQDGSILSPAEFIPVAESAGLVDKIDYTVFKDASVFFGDLIRKTGLDITLSVNVSVRHLMKNDFLDEIREVIELSGVPARQIEIEITESIMIDSVDKALQCINDLKEMGIRIAIDDFGTGYSSLSYLNSFPADILKVDKSFIDKLNSSDASRQYVAAIISIGHVMNFGVISEGVEEADQLETLRNIGCDYIQGFIWGRPMAPEDAEELVYAEANQIR